MKKYLLSLFAVIIAVSLSAFTAKHVSKKATLDTYYWYVVDYSSNPSGEVPSGSSPEFSGVKETQPFAQSNDDCPDINQIHCLRGFLSMPSLPTTSFDSSTPSPNE